MTKARTSFARLLPLAALAAAALVSGCEAPKVSPLLDSCAPDAQGVCTSSTPTGVIQGSVTYQGTRRGDVILLLFNTLALPPPDGIGSSAASIARIPAGQVFGTDTSAGPFSATFRFSQVPKGTYQIRAFIDRGSQFNPFFDYAQQPHAGDPVGGHVDAQLRLDPIVVGDGALVSGVGVAIGPELPFDPPAFVLASGDPALAAVNTAMDRPALLTIKIADPKVTGANLPAAHFAVELDRSADGQTQMADGDGLVDVYPKVFLRQLDSVAPNGAASRVADADAAVIPAKAVALPLLPLLLASPTPVPVDTLTIQVQPLAVKLTAPAKPGDRPGFATQPAIPRGHYQIVVVEKSGQLWTLPNSLGADAAQGTPYYIANQATSVFVDTPANLATGAISGTVHFDGGTAPKSGNIIVQAYRADPANPPPPLGAQAPVRVKLIRAADVTKTSTGFSAPFRIDGVPNGNYLVTALDDVDGNFNTLNLLATPTKGDLVGGHFDAMANLAPVVVQGGDVTGTDVALAQRIPTDPPAFELDDTLGVAAMTADTRTTQRFGIVAKAFSFPPPAGALPPSAFAVRLVRNAAGQPVDSDGDGLLDVWPRVFLVQLDPSDPTGLTPASRPIIIPAAVDPTPFLPQLLNGPPSTTLLRSRLSVIARPAALDVSNPARPTRLVGIPPGRYKVVLVSATGQLWQLPNEAGTAAIDPRVTTCGSCAAQGRSFVVGPPAIVPVPPGEIDGTISPLVVPGKTVRSVTVFATNVAENPVVGTGTPISADIHSGLEFQAGPVNFALAGLPAGTYRIQAIYDVRGDFALDPAFLLLAPGEGSYVGTGNQPTYTVGSAAVGGATVTPQLALPPRPSFQVSATVGGPPASSEPVLSLGGTRSFVLNATSVVSPNFSVVPESPAVFPVLCAGPTALPPVVRLVLLDAADPLGLRFDRSGDGGLTFIDSTNDATAACPTPGGVTSMTVTLAGTASHRNADGTTSPVSLTGTRRFAVFLTSRTGQSWRTPNELQPSLVDFTNFTPSPTLSSVVASQAVGVQVGP